MCIRDSAELVAYGQSGAEHVPLLRGDFRLADALRDAHPACRNVRAFIRLAVDADVGGDDPVSYTHLRSSERMSRPPASIITNFTFCLALRLPSVSYTHLDVYKRQG